MRVLFLDIDGVLNNAHTKERCDHYIGVDRVLAKRLSDWLKTTDIQIVLSSTWRKNSAFIPNSWPHLNEAGIHWMDITPDLGGYHSRGEEIQVWLNDHPDTVYAILDDIPVFLPHQMPRFVNTDPMVGLTDHNIEQLKALFGG